MKTLLISMALFCTACGAIEEAERVATFPYHAYETYENREEFRSYFRRVFLDVSLSLQWLEYGQISFQQLIDNGNMKTEALGKLINEYCNGELCSGLVVERELYLWCDGATSIEDCWFVKPSYIVLNTEGIQ